MWNRLAVREHGQCVSRKRAGSRCETLSKGSFAGL
ncbi:sperm protamine P1 family protein [Burkholderia sp. Ax-1735]|nr:sperm protamine P1 family protein [Burkholderia sp. Ap-955]NIF12323.1 sperm protamine P1 family protein [Burkholderia sp. Ax-1735]NIG05635.1 sperm protamine P1 family protein [Burkholderia sp. Tr-849]